MGKMERVNFNALKLLLGKTSQQGNISCAKRGWGRFYLVLSICLTTTDGATVMGGKTLKHGEISV
jgi:hypothetical protein